MKKVIFSLMALFLCVEVAHAGRIRSKSLSKYQIGKLKLAQDYCTLVEVPVKNFKLIAGAPEYLEIEYQKDSFLIKPKASGIKTNLFVLTSSGRFNLHIETTRAPLADEVVSLKFKSGRKK
jgi:hypothetical protein